MLQLGFLCDLHMSESGALNSISTIAGHTGARRDFVVECFYRLSLYEP